MSRCMLVLVGVVCATAPLSHLFAQESEQNNQQQLRAETKPQESSPIERDAVVQQVIERTNAFRQQQQLAPVDTDNKLSSTAQDFANYMAKNDVYGHRADGQRPSQRAADHGYEYCLIAENIANVFSTTELSVDRITQQFVEGWKNSPEHRENMLDPDVTEIGVGVAQSSETGYIYAVQMFGRPQSLSIRFEMANQSNVEVPYSLGKQTLRLPPRYSVIHERCRPGDVRFLLGKAGQQDQADQEPGDDAQQQDEQGRVVTVTPEGGEKYVIARQAGELQVQRPSRNTSPTR